MNYNLNVQSNRMHYTGGLVMPTKSDNKQKDQINLLRLAIDSLMKEIFEHSITNQDIGLQAVKFVQFDINDTNHNGAEISAIFEHNNKKNPDSFKPEYHGYVNALIQNINIILQDEDAAFNMVSGSGKYEKIQFSPEGIDKLLQHYQDTKVNAFDDHIINAALKQDKTDKRNDKLKIKFGKNPIDEKDEPSTVTDKKSELSTTAMLANAGLLSPDRTNTNIEKKTAEIDSKNDNTVSVTTPSSNLASTQEADEDRPLSKGPSQN